MEDMDRVESLGGALVDKLARVNVTFGCDRDPEIRERICTWQRSLVQGQWWQRIGKKIVVI